MLRQLATTTFRSLSRARTYAAEATGNTVLVHMGGVFEGEVDQVFAKAHKAICGTGGEIKEVRSCRLGGRYAQMFLVANADQEAIKTVLKDFRTCHLDVVPARLTTKDIKGPYCATSPLVPFVRKAKFLTKWRRGIVGDVTEFLNKNGVTVTDLDQYRMGQDVVLEGFAHLPTGLAEFPQVKESELLEQLKGMGVQVKAFDKVTGQDPPEGKAAEATA